MKKSEFIKVYGVTERSDELIKLCSKHYVLFYGFGKDEAGAEVGYTWRKDYDHLPTVEELRGDLIAHINRCVDEEILTGFRYEDEAVYLSTENQFNYKAAFDLCVMTEGKNLPVTFKFGSEHKPSYRRFERLEELTDFFTKAMTFVQTTLANGWKEKDALESEIEELLTQLNKKEK